MNIAGLGAHHPADEIGERARGRERRLLTVRDDGAGDAARVPLLAEEIDDVGEIAFRRARHDIGRVGPACPIRMSSGPSRRNEKPRPAWSSCIEDTPTSITTPSTPSTP